MQEFYVNVTQEVARPLDSQLAAQIVTDLAAWTLHCPGVQDVLDAVLLQDRYSISFWDAMILTSAIQLGCQTIWSEDLSPGRVYGPVKVLNPF